MQREMGRNLGGYKNGIAKVFPSTSNVFVNVMLPSFQPEKF